MRFQAPTTTRDVTSTEAKTAPDLVSVTVAFTGEVGVGTQVALKTDIAYDPPHISDALPLHGIVQPVGNFPADELRFPHQHSSLFSVPYTFWGPYPAPMHIAAQVSHDIPPNPPLTATGSMRERI